MESGEHGFSLKESLSFVTPTSPSSSLSSDTSLAVFDEETNGGSETVGKFDQHRKDSQSSLKTGRKEKRKVACERSRKKGYKVSGLESFPELSDKKLEKMTIKELNSFIQGIPKRQAQKIKKRRRILKNRKYALKCRLKLNQKKTRMAEENTSLEKTISATKADLQAIIKQRDYYKSKCLQLQSHLESTFFNATEAW